MSDVKVKIIRESLRASILSDVVTLLSTFIIIGVGIFADSNAMQWIGFIFVMIFILGRGLGDKDTFTPQECANWLKKEYNVQALQQQESHHE